MPNQAIEQKMRCVWCAGLLAQLVVRSAAGCPSLRGHLGRLLLRNSQRKDTIILHMG